MATEDQIEQIETSLGNPAAAEVDGVVARQHSLKEQRETIDWINSQENNALDSSKRVTGLRISRFTPPSALGE